MELARKIELGGGLSSALAATIIFTSLLRQPGRRLHSFEIFENFLLLLLPGLLVGLGSYVHAVSERVWAFGMLWAAGMVYIAVVVFGRITFAYALQGSNTLQLLFLIELFLLLTTLGASLLSVILKK